MCSACSGFVMRPTAAVGMLASVRIAVAKGTWKFGLASILALCIAPPDETSMRSTPRLLS